MDTRRRIMKIITRGLVIGLIVFAITWYVKSTQKYTKEDVPYTVFFQMVNENTINSIEVEENSNVISGYNQGKPNYIYVSKAPDVKVLTEYVQGKILNGDEINFMVKEEGKNGVLSAVSFLLKFWPLYVIILLYKFFKSFIHVKKVTSNSNPDEIFATMVDNGGNNIEKITNSTVTFKDVKGLDEEIQEVSEIVDFIKNPDKYTALGAKIPKGVLLDGEPGTGKTLLAKAIAGEAGIPFITTSGSNFVEKYVGVGASRIRALFDTARKNAPCIIFIDEIDAVGSKRDDAGRIAEHNQTLEQLLAEMDGFTERTNIVVLAATNRLSSLDPALIRPGRFDRQITVHLPDRKGREEILKLHGSNKPFDESVDFSNVAYNTAGFSGAALENLLNEAALIAARKSQKCISNKDITEAMMKIQVGLQKAGRVITEKERRLTAVHEAGHVVASLFLETQANIKEVCIIPRGTAGGYTLHHTIEDKNYITKKELTERLVSLLGGKAAESVVLGDISTGPSNDLRVATETAREMIIYYGMDDEVGPISFAGISNADLEIFGGKTLGTIGIKISEMVKNAEKEAIKIITENRLLLDELVNKLLEQETLSGEEIEAIHKSYME